MWELFKLVAGAVFSVLASRLIPKKDPSTEDLKHEVTAQRNEAKNLATPAPADWKSVVDEL